MRNHPANQHRGRWLRLRRWIVNVRDNRRCQSCGRVVGRPELDHIVAVHLGGDPWDPSNLQTLCAFPCHADKTRLENANPEPADRREWREYMAKSTST